MIKVFIVCLLSCPLLRQRKIFRKSSGNGDVGGLRQHIFLDALFTLYCGMKKPLFCHDE